MTIIIKYIRWGCNCPFISRAYGGRNTQKAP